MRLHRFFYKFYRDDKTIKIDDRELINQFKNVLRLKVGDMVLFFDDNYNESEAKLLVLQKNLAKFEIIRTYHNTNEPDRNVILYCSILKRENFELVVSKATEVGVKEIVPIITNRTVKLSFNYNRYNKIIKEAAEQAGRGVLPLLHESIDFKHAHKRAKENSSNFLFDISGKSIFSTSQVENIGYDKKIGVFVGPEGGWTKEEIEMAKTAKIEIVSLGNLTLRAETAAIIGSYVAVHVF